MKEQAVAVGALPDPTMRVGLANFPIESGGFSTEGMTQAQFGIRQAFPRGRSLGTEQMHERAEAFSQSADARRRDVFFDDLVTITRSMYGVGRKTQHDVLRAELELSRLDDRLIEASRARAEAQAALSRWLGQDAYRPIAQKLPTWESMPMLEDLRDGLASHPSLAAGQASIAAKETAVDIAEENKKPDWALDLAYGYRDGFLPDGTPRSDFVSLSVTVGLPFFGENRQDRKLAAALSERRAARYSQHELAARLNSELAAEYARWIDLTRRLTLYETLILEQSKGQAQAALLSYQSDTGDFSDVMRGYIDDLNTRLEHIRLQVERAQSYAALANLGGLEQ
jgi:outer membrane protein TolC